MYLSKDKNQPSFARTLVSSMTIQLFKTISKSFFRSIKLIGVENIPQNEPVILCANHQNQFMDAVNIFTHVSTGKRPVRFLIAGKSYRKPVIGHCASTCFAIPVERAQDFAKNGKGKITSIVNDRVRGDKTQFKSEIKVNESISIKGIEFPIIVKEIISDLELIVADTKLEKQECEYGYKIQPKIDQSFIYNAVSDCLNNNDLIGIFPEGGSSDRTEMLPLKAGVCIMALEAMTKYNKPVNIVCCGVNYFKGHKFRSKVTMEFGIPYKIPIEYVDEYKRSKRDTVAKLLEKISEDMKEVLYTAPSYQDLQGILMAKRIYTPNGRFLTPWEDKELTKRFSKGYVQFQDKAEIQQVMQQVLLYRDDLKLVGISDREIKKIKKSFLSDFLLFLKSFVVFLTTFSFALPGVLLNGPVGFVLSTLSVKERQKCLKESSVKIKGNDVVASYQVKLALVALPLYHCFFSIMLYFIQTGYFKQPKKISLLYTILFFILYPFYAYMMLKSTDRFIRCFKNMKSRILLLFSYEQIKGLREKRRKIKQSIRVLVKKYFAEVCGQDNDRICEDDSDDDRKVQDSQKGKHKFINVLGGSIDNKKFKEDTFKYLEELGI